MSHWAELDQNNVVLRVIVGNNNDPDEGYSWIINNLGGTWMKCSYNNNIRKNYPGVGYSYDSVRDAFIPPKPFPSWVLNETTCQWDSPVPFPVDQAGLWVWNEDQQNWVQS